jgi:hypothetical protein
VSVILKEVQNVENLSEILTRVSFSYNDQAHLPAVQLPINLINGYQLETTPKFTDELRVR